MHVGELLGMYIGFQLVLQALWGRPSGRGRDCRWGRGRSQLKKMIEEEIVSHEVGRDEPVAKTPEIITVDEGEGGLYGRLWKYRGKSRRSGHW